MYIDLHALLVNIFEQRVLRIEPFITAVQRCASRSTEFAFAIANRSREPGRDVKNLSDRMLRIKGSAEFSVVHVEIDLHALPMNNYTTTRRTENAFEEERLPAST